MKNNNIRLCGDPKIDAAIEVWREHRRIWREKSRNKNKSEKYKMWVEEFNKMIKNNT